MAEQGMDGWEGGVLAQLARLSAEYQGSGKACARTWREGAHVPGSYKVWESGCGAMYNPEKRSLRVPTLANQIDMLGHPGARPRVGTRAFTPRTVARLACPLGNAKDALDTIA